MGKKKENPKWFEMKLKKLSFKLSSSYYVEHSLMGVPLEFVSMWSALVNVRLNEIWLACYALYVFRIGKFWCIFIIWFARICLFQNLGFSNHLGYKTPKGQF